MADEEFFLKLLTDETFGSAITKQPRFSFTENTLQALKLEFVGDNFLRLTVDGKGVMDFPVNWGVFKEVSLDCTVSLRESDKLLNDVLCEYLGFDVDIVLIRSTEGFYLVCNEIKKAA